MASEKNPEITEYDVSVTVDDHPETKTKDVNVQAFGNKYTTTVLERDVTKGFIARSISNIIFHDTNKFNRKTAIQIVEQKVYILNKPGRPRYQGKTDE